MFVRDKAPASPLCGATKPFDWRKSITAVKTSILDARALAVQLRPFSGIKDFRYNEVFAVATSSSSVQQGSPGATSYFCFYFDSV